MSEVPRKEVRFEDLTPGEGSELVVSSFSDTEQPADPRCEFPIGKPDPSGPGT